MKRKTHHYFIAATVGLVLGILITVGSNKFRESDAAPSGTPNYEYLDLFTKVLHFVQNNYVEEVDQKKLIEGAIKGMLSNLDPHSIYLSPEQFKEMQVDTTGKFGGLGIEITVQDGYLTVVTPIDGTPAFRAGVEPGDKIIIIEDKSKKLKKETKGLTLQEAVNMMRGERGTKVTIHVLRKGVDKLTPYELTRENINVASVKGGMIEPDYAWLRITNFQGNTSKDLRKKIEQLIAENKKPLQGVVLDLRNNPGGLLEEAVNVSGTFVGREKIVSTMGRNKKEQSAEFSSGKSPYTDFKLIVLVNEASASASEIVAGALQDLKRAIIVGKQTFGKGSVQTVIDLDNKAGLKLTVARYHLPSGRVIQSKGITPDIEVDRLDMALVDKAKKTGRYLKEADLEGHLLGDDEKGDKGDSDKEDPSKITKGEDGKDRDKRPVKEKDGKKLRMDDPKEMIKTDFQLQQALGYLKAWKIFEPPFKKTEKSEKSAKADKAKATEKTN